MLDLERLLDFYNIVNIYDKRYFQYIVCFYS